MANIKNKIFISFVSGLCVLGFSACASSIINEPIVSTTKLKGKYNIVDTNQEKCFNNYGNEISCKNSGQDGELHINRFNYTDNKDGTIRDNVTNLIWQKSADINGDGDINYDDKLSFYEAKNYCSDLKLASYTDWRLPDIKTLYSLIDFRGQDVSGKMRSRFINTSSLNPFLNTDYFEFGYGDTSNGERIIDAQWASSTKYVSTTMNRDETMFGVNFADGRIKGYPIVDRRRGQKKFYVQCVRGNTEYGKNNFIDNKNGTISDKATNLMWHKIDNKGEVDFSDAIDYCKSSNIGGYEDWRLPNIKELQSIVDYSRSPETSKTASIDVKFFEVTKILNENSDIDFGAYWSSTTHENMRDGANSAYISFGKSMGYFHNRWLDVHGAGAQRSDPKSINKSFGRGYRTIKARNGKEVIIHGPQGDVVRGKNFVRCVRDD